MTLKGGDENGDNTTDASANCIRRAKEPECLDSRAAAHTTRERATVRINTGGHDRKYTFFPGSTNVVDSKRFLRTNPGICKITF